MIDLFYEGGILFMGMLTLIFLCMLVSAILNYLQLFNGKEVSDFQLNAVKSIGLFALVIGVLGQLIGLFSAFEAISQMEEISQAMLAGGLKVSSITTIYGILISLVAYVIWFSQGYWKNRLES